MKEKEIFPLMIENIGNNESIKKGDYRRYLERIFEREISIFQYLGKEIATSLLEKVFYLAFDPGLMRSGLCVLTRRAFTNRLIKKIGFTKTEKGLKFNCHFQVFKFDLKGIGSMDEAVGDEKIRALADGLSSYFNQPIILTDENGNNFFINPDNIIFGRYGGDEFVVGLVHQGVAIGNIFLKNLINKIGQIRDSDGEKIELKGEIGTFDSFISSPEKIEIFLSRLSSGQVLSSNEIEKERDKIKFELELPIIPENFSELERAISLLVAQHKEFRLFFRIALHLDLLSNRLSKSNNFLRTITLYEFIINNVFDSLLGTITISRGDLLFHLRNGEFKKAFAFEIKIKEVNDRISNCYGDIIIIQLWKKIIEVFGEKIDKFRIGRFGGLIVVFCDNKEFSLNDEQRRQLSEVDIDGLRHVVGFSEIDLSDLALSEKVKKIYEAASFDWLEKVLRYYIKNEAARTRFFKFLDPVQEPENPRDMDYLHASYFHPSSRLKKRREQLVSVCERFPELKEICQQIIDQIDKG